MTVGGRVSGAIGRIGVGLRGDVRRAVAGTAVLVALLALPAVAFASDAPHVSTDDGPDACAMCHRAHTAPGVVARSQAGSWDATGSALIIAQPSNTGDQALCLACHGIDGFGSTLDVQSDFLRDSVHLRTPDVSAYGPSAKQCSSCHDAHGAEKDPLTDLPFARLLRAFTSTGDIFYQAEEYCATCHFDARDEQFNRFDGLDIYKQTAHFVELSVEAPDTEITCSICHAAHGSDFAPLIQPAVVPSGPVTETVPIAGNDRSLCYVCHEVEHVTYDGEIVYDDSVHGLSEVAVPVVAEWTGSEETTRLAGECQNCHNPMGADDGDGTVIPKLVEAEGRELCYGCHNEEMADETGGAVVDMASAGVRPYEVGEEGAELVVAWDPENLPLAYSAVHVHTQVRNVDPPRELEGPRRYLSGSRSGAMAYGDIDGLGDTELVVADPSGPCLTVMRYDPLAGLASARYSIAGSVEDTSSAAFVAVGDFVSGGTPGSAQVAVVSIDGLGDSTLSVYAFGNSFTRIAGPVSVGQFASGLATGDLGGSRGSLVVTSLTSDDTVPGEIRVVAESTPGNLAAGGPYATGIAPRGPSIKSASEIVYANSGQATDNLVIAGPLGVVQSSYTVTIPGGAGAWDTAVGDFLPGGESGVAVAMRSETGANAVALYEIAGASLVTTPAIVPTGDRYASSALAVGDLNGDGVDQLAVGNAGLFSRTEGQSVSPSVQVLAEDAGELKIADTRWGGGVEMAGGTASLAVVDLGPVGRSRHPASAIPGAHDSEEEGDFARHAECVDCHNVHTMNADVATAPDAYGLIAGTWGMDADTNQLKQGVDYEYELCFKCHTAGWGGTAPPSRDILAELDPAANGSVHPVMTDSAEGRVYCIDCHGNAEAVNGEPAGPHVSTSAPLLREPFFAARSFEATQQLCYNTCHHDFDIYYGGDPGSEFYDATSGVQLHPRHVNDFEMACQTCHTSHGSSNNFLIREDLDWVEATEGGGCFTTCHADEGSAGNAYSRSSLGG